MTNQQAYKYLEKVYSTTKNDSYRDALAVALATLKNDQSVDTNKMAPLTLEQFRKMEGKPVWIEVLENKFRVCRIVVDAKGVYIITVGIGGLCLIAKDYGKTWLAYDYPTARIDREAWKPCELCGSLNDEIMCQFSKYTAYDQSATSRYTSANFCPNCGKPLTPEAWDELEKRLGVNEDG